MGERPPIECTWCNENATYLRDGPLRLLRSEGGCMGREMGDCWLRMLNQSIRPSRAQGSHGATGNRRRPSDSSSRCPQKISGFWRGRSPTRAMRLMSSTTHAASQIAPLQRASSVGFGGSPRRRRALAPSTGSAPGWRPGRWRPPARAARTLPPVDRRGGGSCAGLARSRGLARYARWRGRWICATCPGPAVSRA